MAESTYEVGVDVTTLGENKDEAANETKAENVENTAETVEENKD